MTNIIKTTAELKGHNESGSSELAILAEQTSQLYANVSNAIIATVINSLILVFVLWPVVEAELLLSWLFSILFVSLLRGIIAYRYKKTSPLIEQPHIWARYFISGSIAASIMWGASSIWIFPQDDLARQVFLAFVVGGMAAAAIISLSYIKLAVYTFLLFTLVPLMIRFFYSGTDLSLAMGSMIALYFAVLFQSAKLSYDKNKENICMRIDNAEQLHSLNQSEHRYKTLLDTATDAFFLHDLDGRILDVNNQACLSLGYTKAELVTLSVSDIDVDTGGPLVDWTRLSEAENIRIESTHRRKDGSTFPVEVGIGYVQMGSDLLVSVLARDITERKRIEKMKNEFISTVSHELRTPLTSIKGSLGLMTGGAVGVLPSQAQDILTIAENNAERLLLLINDLLDIQKIETGELAMKLEKIELVSFLRQSINDNNAYAEQYGVSLVLESCDETLYINANKDRLMQVMANLLSNAVKFSHKNGTVEVSATRPDVNVIRVSVTDHGEGIAKEFYSTIFDKFTQQDSSDTRQKGGTGLGLSITKSIIEKHNGELSFISKAGAGTTFYFDLPEFIYNK
ncbi:MAG: ATP-binding protein [Gammaproteobacteria bacterium]|nr:ATP-binding protein [Gammaproteobacteria bacterium]MCW8988108.1 ATP-binding protein [Gammaproteobacteria bacterium]